MVPYPQINVIYHVNKMKDKDNHLTDTERAYDKIQCPLMTTIFRKLEIVKKKKLLQMNKEHL